LLGFLRPTRGKIAGAVAALVLSSLAMLAFGIGLRWLVDNGFHNGGNALDWALLGLLGIVSVLATATYFRAYLVNWIGERVAADIQRAVFANVLRLEPAFFETTPTGEVVSRLTNDTTLLQTISAPPPRWRRATC
jgi:ATP-binding cassette, subfamily B, bacterial